MDKNYYDISYSVKTIDPAWIAGNGKNEGLWVNNKSGFFVLIKNDNQYIFLNRVGGGQWPADLSHHRAYRSVHGGSLVFTDLLIIAHQGDIPLPGYFFVWQDGVQHEYRSPWSFPAVG